MFSGCSRRPSVIIDPARNYKDPSPSNSKLTRTEIMFNARVVSNLEWSKTPVTNALQLVIGPKFNDFLVSPRQMKSPWDDFTVKTLASLRARALLRRGVEGYSIEETPTRQGSDGLQSTFSMFRCSNNDMDLLEGHRDNQPGFRDKVLGTNTSGHRGECPKTQLGLRYHIDLGTSIARPSEVLVRNKSSANTRNTRDCDRKENFDSTCASGHGVCVNNTTSRNMPRTVASFDHRRQSIVPCLTDDDDMSSVRSTSPSPRPYRVPHNTPSKHLAGISTTGARKATTGTYTKPSNARSSAVTTRVRKLSPDPAPFYPATRSIAQRDALSSGYELLTTLQGYGLVDTSNSIEPITPVSLVQVARPGPATWLATQHEAAESTLSCVSDTRSMDSLIEEQVRFNAAVEEAMPRKAVLADFLKF